MANFASKKTFLFIFCLASIIQGMFSTYFVSTLTTIEKLFHFQSKTSGAIMSATEVGTILGSVVISYYGGRGNKPRWLTACMLMSGLAAILFTSPHFFMHTTVDREGLSTTNPKANALELRHVKIDELCLAQSSHELAKDPIIDPRVLDDGEKSTMIRRSSDTQANLKEPIEERTNLIPSRNQSDLPQYEAYIIDGSRRNLMPVSTFTSDQETMMHEHIPSSNQKRPNKIVDKRFEESQQKDLFSRPRLRHSTKLVFVIFFFSLLVIGFGSTSMTTLGIPFIDDIVSREESPLYLGVTIGLRILGPALGFLLGSVCMKISVDFLDPVIVLSTLDDPTGAWWLGLFVISLPLCMLAIPMYYFSRMKIHSGKRDHSDHDQRHATGIQDKTFNNHEEPGHDQHRHGKRTVKGQIEDAGKDEFEHLAVFASCASRSTDTIGVTKGSIASEHSTSIRNLFVSLHRLLKNRAFVLRVFSSVLHILPIAGFYTFLPKYLIEQFGVAASNASAISGLAGILFVGIGAFIGGTIVRAFSVGSRGVTRWTASSALLFAIGMLVLMNLGCPQAPTMTYDTDMIPTTPVSCQSDCHCRQNIYNPICIGQTTYLSPCLAGCTNYTEDLNTNQITYHNCQCQSLTFSDHDQNPQTDVATGGLCPTECHTLKWYVVVFSLFVLTHASCEVGSMMLNLRCVEPGDRALALGVITFATSLLGNIPCSIIYGTLIDYTCTHWDTSFDADGGLVRGACRLYDNSRFRIYLHCFTAFVMFVAFIVDCIMCSQASKVNFYLLDDEPHKRDLTPSPIDTEHDSNSFDHYIGLDHTNHDLDIQIDSSYRQKTSTVQPIRQDSPC